MNHRHVLALIAAVATLPARAGLFDKLQQSAQDAAAKATSRTVERKINDATSSKPAPPTPAQRAPAGPQQPAAQSGASSQPAAQAGVPEAPPLGEVYSNRFDFVPGDKVLVFDDLSDSDVGEYPARWTVKDGGGGNPVEVVELGKARWAKSRDLGKAQRPSLMYLRYAIRDDMPPKFTLELDAELSQGLNVHFTAPHGFGGQSVFINRFGEGHVKTLHVESPMPAVSGPQHVSIAVSGTQVKVYVGGQRVLSDPDGVERPVKRIGLEFPDPRKGGDRQMFTNFRLAEGGKDAKTLLASGRIVTHGILFDSGSDVLRPESGPALRAILALLQEDAALGFRVEGHTDDQGGAALNGPLSERRAAAVKAWLVKQGIPEGRLQVQGFGATRPLDPASTPEARANNRRVEFVKL